MTNIRRPSVTKPNGLTGADLLQWWHQRAEASPTATEQGYLSVCRDVLSAVVPAGDLGDLGIGVLDVEQALADMADGAWKPLSATTRRNYSARFRRAIADFRTALSDPTSVRTIRHRASGTSPMPVSADAAVRIAVMLPDGTTALLRLDRAPEPGDVESVLDMLRPRLVEVAGLMTGG
jgi:hypothetical protein